MPTTIKDVAKMAGVSPSTVSRVIADHPKISQATKDRVAEAMEVLQYRPNAIARSLANKSTKTLGLLLPNSDEDLLQNPFYVQVMRGISRYAQKAGYYILYSYTDHEEQEIKMLDELLHSKWVDGVILTTIRENDRCVEFLRANQHHFVVIGTPEEHGDEILWVDNNNSNAMYEVVANLVEKGHKRIGFIGGPHEFAVTRYRLRGYQKALKHYGIPFQAEWVVERDYTEKAGYEVAKELFERAELDAIVTTDDLIAFGVQKALLELGKKEVALTGFNNTILADYKNPPISSVDIKAEALGYEAAKLLITNLKEKSDVTHCLIDTEFIERESSCIKG